MQVRVEGQLVFNTRPWPLQSGPCRAPAWPSAGGPVRAHLSEGRLIRVLADWCPPFSGFHLYYPSRRQPTPAFAVLVNALRYSR